MSHPEQPNAFDQIQSICREYRKHLKRGEVKPMERFLDRVGEPSRGVLFQNLLHIDIEYRRRSGENPSSDEYCSRFPDHAKLIRQAFFESTMMSRDLLDDTPEQIEPHVTLGIPIASRLGNYELLRELGRGGFGVVYQARHIDRGDRLALKTLPMMSGNAALSASDAERLHRFRREFRSLAEINHPNLAGMQTLETDGNQWFFTMDLIEGDDFLGYVRPNGALDESRLRATIKQIACGVIALHDQGIVHRDLKPSNVLVGKDGRVTILDFGLVAQLQHFANETLSIGTKNFAGTPRYAAPEQVAGQRGAAVDWYSLGVMVFEAITGNAPFKGSSVDLLIAKQTQDPPRLSGRDGVPNDLAALVDALLQRDPLARPDDAAMVEKLGVDTESTVHASSSSESEVSEGSISGDNFLLVGRESQLVELHQNLKVCTVHRQPRAVFISGRSGEGKSTLAEAFLYKARRDQGTLVFSGRCYDRESVPFKAIDCLIDPLVAFLRGHDRSDLENILPSDIGMLAHLFPVLRRVEAVSDRCTSVVTHIDSRQIRYRAFSALRELLTNLGRSRPIILYVDDLQWGDADSAAALHEVLRPPDSPAVLMLGSYRSDEAKSSQFLSEWNEKQFDPAIAIEQHEVKVGPLSEDDCMLLISSRLGIAPEDLRRKSSAFFEDTQGNPYFVEQLIEGFDAESKQFRSVPLEDLIDRKLGRLPAAAKALLESISISGQSASVDEIAEVSQQKADAFTTLTHMRSERLVRLIDSQGRQFVDTYHDKIRETVLTNMPDQHRRILHLRFSRWIERQDNISSQDATAILEHDCADEDNERPIPAGRIYDLAYHYLSAGDPKGFIYQLLAAEQSFRSYASEDALACLDRVFHSIPDSTSNRIRFRALHRRASSLARLRQFDEALETYRQAMAAAETTEAQALCQYGIARTFQFLGDYRQASQTFDEALKQFGLPRPGPVGAVIRLPWLTTRVLLIPYQWQRSSSQTRAKLAGWEQKIYSSFCLHFCEVHHPIDFIYGVFRHALAGIQTGHQKKVANGFTELGAYIAWAGFLWLSRRIKSKALKVASDTVTDEGTSMTAFYNGFVSASTGLHQQAESQYREALPVLIKRGLHLEAYVCSHFLRHLLAVSACSTAELKAARETLHLAEETGSLQGQCWGSYDIALALARGGQLQSAHQWIERAQKCFVEDDMHATGAIFLHAQGFVLMQASDYETAAVKLEAAWQTTLHHKLIMEYLFAVLASLIECTAGPNWVSQPSAERARRLRTLGSQSRMIDWVFLNLKPHFLRARGRFFAALGKKRKATPCFRKSLKIATDLRMDYDRAKALLDLAAIQRADRDKMRREAISLLKKQESVIPHAEAWLLGDQFDPAVVAPAPGQVASQ